MKIGDENGKLTKFGIISAVFLGLMIGYFACRDTIADITTPKFNVIESEANSQAGIYRVWVVPTSNSKKEDVQKIGKKIVRIIDDSYTNTVIIFFYKNQSDYEKNREFNLARMNFEKYEEDLLSKRLGKYKGLYYSLDYVE